MSRTWNERLIKLGAAVYLAAALCAYTVPFVVIFGALYASIL